MSTNAHVEELKRKHLKLSEKVERIERHPSSDPSEIASLKKQKLRLKDEIQRLS